MCTALYYITIPARTTEAVMAQSWARFLAALKLGQGPSHASGHPNFSVNVQRLSISSGRNNDH